MTADISPDTGSSRGFGSTPMPGGASARHLAAHAADSSAGSLAGSPVDPAAATSQPAERPSPLISIVIKAFNEERNIAAAIESALAAVAGMDGEIILADSLSSDRTVEIARGYPITIVRLLHGGDRSCGAGAQLGYQYSRGRYVCIVDGDMQLEQGFLAAAVQYLGEHPEIAGVGGTVIECEQVNLEYVKRRINPDPNLQPGPVNRLDCSGVYRRSALEAVGYLTDRNLHSCEELDLGARLISRGMSLIRLDRPAVAHAGHSGSAYRLLFRRWTSRVAFGPGELIRSAIGRPHFRASVAASKWLALWVAVQFWWICLLFLTLVFPGGLTGLAMSIALLMMPIAIMTWRCRSLAMAFYSVTAWNIYTLGFWPGFFRRRISPTAWIESETLRCVCPATSPSMARARTL